MNMTTVEKDESVKKEPQSFFSSTTNLFFLVKLEIYKSSRVEKRNKK